MENAKAPCGESVCLRSQGLFFGVPCRQGMMIGTRGGLVKSQKTEF